MKTPFHASKLGAILLSTAALWGGGGVLAVVFEGPKHLEAGVHHQLARLYHHIRSAQHHRFAAPSGAEDA